jgi:diguanylate cyclase (GGDEF)-like protein
VHKYYVTSFISDTKESLFELIPAYTRERVNRINVDSARIRHSFPAMEKAPTFITKLRKQQVTTPQLSSAAKAYVELAQQPNPDIGIAADTLATEPTAVARIMALANSDLFIGHRQNTNSHQALTNLGVKEALLLSIACEAFSALQKLPVGNINFDAFGKRACIAAVWAKILADEFGRNDCAELLLTAMLQNAGLLLISHGAPEIYDGLDPLTINRRSLARLEFFAIKTDHRLTSAWLAATWKLPDNVAHTLRLGNDLAADDVAHQDRGFHRAVNFCADLAEAWCCPLTARIVKQITADAQRYLGISPERLAELFNTVAAQAPQFAEILSLESCALRECEATAKQFHDLLPPSNIRILPVHGLSSQPAHDNAKDPQAQAAIRAPAANLLHPMSLILLLEEEFTQASRHDWPLSLLLVEIDNFQEMNERCGIELSARIRNDIAALLSHNIRSSDTIVPLNENQFMIVLPGSNADTASAVAQRVVNNARRRIAYGNHDDRFPVTVSLGVTTLDQDAPFSSADELSTAAKAALDFSTRSGHDRHTTYASIQAA